MMRISAWLSKHLLWNAVFRFILQQAPPLMIAAGINGIGVSDAPLIFSMKMRFNREFGVTLSSILSILVGIGVVAVIGVFYWIIRTKRGLEGFSQKYGTLT
jgi:hypothetical protein